MHSMARCTSKLCKGGWSLRGEIPSLCKGKVENSEVVVESRRVGRNPQAVWTGQCAFRV